jgi:hypothetical protein
MDGSANGAIRNQEAQYCEESSTGDSELGVGEDPPQSIDETAR